MRLLCVLFALAMVAGCAAGRETVPMPAGLVGTWTSDDALYQDRFFELSETTLVIGTGEGREASYPIAGVYLTEDDRGSTVHVVEYVDAGSKLPMAFYFSSSEGTVRMRNRPMIVWRRGSG